jgi:hypothetical protein
LEKISSFVLGDSLRFYFVDYYFVQALVRVLFAHDERLVLSRRNAQAKYTIAGYAIIVHYSHVDAILQFSHLLLEAKDFVN